MDEEFTDEKIIKEIIPKDERKIYVGPNVLKFGLERYMIFKNGLPLNVQDAVAKIPEIAKLIIPVEELIAYTHKILNPGSIERQYHNIIQRKIKEMV